MTVEIKAADLRVGDVIIGTPDDMGLHLVVKEVEQRPRRFMRVHVETAVGEATGHLHLLPETRLFVRREP